MDLDTTMTLVDRIWILFLQQQRKTGNESCCYDDRGRREMDLVVMMHGRGRREMEFVCYNAKGRQEMDLFFCDNKSRQEMDLVTTYSMKPQQNLNTNCFCKFFLSFLAGTRDCESAD